MCTDNIEVQRLVGATWRGIMRLAKIAILGSIATTALAIASGPSFAIEPGDFQATLAGATIGIPGGALPPPGLYGGLETFVGPNANGTGQNSPATGAGPYGKGLSVFGEAITPSLLWSTGWNLFGGNVGFVVVQPFYTVSGFSSNCQPIAGGNCIGTPPLIFGGFVTGAGPSGGAFFENIHNTIFQAIDSWNWKNGWFTSLGFAVQGPDGSQYNGTLNQDYWTFSPTAGISFINKTWKATANLEYDFHTASRGHTGTYAAVGANTSANAVLPAALITSPNGCVGIQCPGNGYQSGDQFYIDWSVEYRWGKLAFGPAGDFKWQTTADSPGSGWTCAMLKASPVYGTSGLGCGRATDISLGGIIGYDFGPAELEVFAVDSVYNKDDFDGWKIFTRLSFKLDDPAPKPEPAAAPMVGKAH